MKRYLLPGSAGEGPKVMKMINDDFTAGGYDRQTSRPGIRRNGGGHEQNRSLRTQNLLTAALFLALLIVGCSLLIVTADEVDAATEGNYDTLTTAPTQG